MLNFENVQSTLAVWLKDASGIPATRANQNQSRRTPGLENGYITYLITSVNQIGQDEGPFLNDQNQGEIIGHLEMILSVQIYHQQSLQIAHNVMSTLQYEKFRQLFWDAGFIVTKYGEAASIAIADSTTLLDKTFEQRSVMEFLIRAGYSNLQEEDALSVIEAINMDVNYLNPDGSIDRSDNIIVDER